MLRFYVFYIVIKILEIQAIDIEGKIKQYFQSETFHSFQKDWQRHRKSYENAIRLALQDNYGHKGMNVYIRKSSDAHRIANGFYLHDRIVGLLLHDMFLGELPTMTNSEITLALASNVLSLDARLENMIVITRYMLFRNQSAVLFGYKDDKKNSPFIYDAVEPFGNVAITAEDCNLQGYGLVKLDGQSIDLGHSTFSLCNCKFTIEISSLGSGRQPVTAPYFNKQQSRDLEKLISKPIREELLPKLQATLLTYINTTLIFGNKLSEYRRNQRRIFKVTSRHILNIIKNLNKNSVQKRGSIELMPFEITWNICVEEECFFNIGVRDVTVYGLDTAYSAHTGGPFKLQSTKIVEAIRFHNVQVRGKLLVSNGTVTSGYDFFVELQDVTFHIDLDLDDSVQNYNFINWGSIDVSILRFKRSFEVTMNANSLISGYLLKEIPTALTGLLHKHLKSLPNMLSLVSDEEEDNENVLNTNKVNNVQLKNVYESGYYKYKGHTSKKDYYNKHDHYNNIYDKVPTESYDDVEGKYDQDGQKSSWEVNDNNESENNQEQVNNEELIVNDRDLDVSDNYYDKITKKKTKRHTISGSTTATVKVTRKKKRTKKRKLTKIFKRLTKKFDKIGEIKGQRKTNKIKKFTSVG